MSSEPMNGSTNKIGNAVDNDTSKAGLADGAAPMTLVQVREQLFEFILHGVLRGPQGQPGLGPARSRWWRPA